MSEPSYEEILKARNALATAEVPMDNRVMYYFVISWWRHPIKRYKQKRAIKELLVTTLDK